MALQFDTNSVPPSQRLALWQDNVCDAFVGLDCSSARQAPFRGVLSQSTVGFLSCTQVNSTEQRVYRTPSRISKSNDEFVLFSLETSGTGAVLQDGREAIIRRGDFVMYDTTRPYELRFEDDFSQTIFQLPRKLLHQRIGLFDKLTATPFVSERPLEKLAYDFLISFARAIDQIEGEAALRLADQALDILAMAIGDRLRSAPSSPSANRAMILYRLQRFIGSRLWDPELSLTAAAAALGVTPRYINSLMADEQTSFSRYVLAQRLEKCRITLSDPGHMQRQVGEIAFAWGFNDLAHFSRRFKERFGVSPRDYRAKPAPV